ncbi:hypothetical protein ACFWP7_13245 [Streptomyces sp. NPDC058470]|uniref:hypothetical protein n=1 Tax=Streptomyces sp. NPDC058470 TaxID=3346515 RepID=UPI00365C2F71
MTKHRTGQWPVAEPADLDAVEESNQGELYTQRAAEIALRELVMDSIKHALRQQPTASCVLSATRRLCSDITAAGDEIAKGLRGGG